MRRPPARTRPITAGALAALLLAVTLLGSCQVHEHTVGIGPNGLKTVRARQFYFMFGLFQLNEVDTERMASEASSYRITTLDSFSDWILWPLLLPLTMSSRTVIVET